MSNELMPTNPKGEIADKITEIDGVAMKIAVSPQSHRILNSLFPGKHTRAIALHELQMAKTEFDFRQRALKCARDAQLQAIQDMYNDYMVRGKANIRRERAEFFLNQFNALQESIQKTSESFEKETQRVWAESENISLPLLKSKKQQLLEQTIQDFYNVVDRLKKDFENILNENVKA